MERAEAGPHPLTDLALFNNQIYALTLIQRYSGYQLPCFGQYVAKENLKLLDSFALLLDQTQEGAVATSMQLTRSAIKLYWARDDNVQSDHEKDYMHRILKHAQDRTDPFNILVECVGYTKERIVSKCQKLAKVHWLSPESQRPMYEDFLCMEKDRDEYRELEQELKANDVIDKYGSLVQHLDDFIRRIGGVSSISTAEELVAITHQAYNLCSRRHKLSIWIVYKAYRDSVEGFQGLAAYMDAVRDLNGDLHNLWSKGYRTFEFEQVISTTQPYESLVNGPVIDALNTWADHHSGVKRIQRLRQLDPYGSTCAERGPEGRVAIRRCQHAELTLALHFVRERLSAGQLGQFGIGVSRGSCYWCKMWLDILNAELKPGKRQIAVRTATGKRVDGWILPEYDLVKKKFLNQFSTQIEKYF